ncbi:hypothetical protein GOQ04_20485 [Emticicia sp. ODNR4P]|nr:hypothetical protein [Emticicia sp. ODNR4P]
MKCREVMHISIPYGSIRQETDLWMSDYNFLRLHVSLRGMSPIDYRVKNKTSFLGFVPLRYTQPKKD